MLLSRVAENLYWAARYLERAEDTARIVREHTNLIVDLPVSVPVTWQPLLAITGTVEEFDERERIVGEADIIHFLVAERDNTGSVVMCVEQARENLRTTREVIPRDAWQAVNDLHLYVASHHLEGVERRSRNRFLDRVIADSQRMVGILAGTMSRDEAYEMLRLGRHVERADMTTRVIDVRAGMLMGERPDGIEHHDDVQWASVLRSLSALHMFHRAVRAPVSAPDALGFLLLDPAFPRSVTHCLREIAACVRRLPQEPHILPSCDVALNRLGRLSVGQITGASLHQLADELQLYIAAIDTRISESWFHADAGGEP